MTNITFFYSFVLLIPIPSEISILSYFGIYGSCKHSSKNFRRAVFLENKFNNYYEMNINIF